MTTVRELPYGDQVALPPDTPLFFKPVKQSWFWGLFDKGDKDDGEHIACPCRPHLTFCGIYDPSPLSDHPIDGTECQDCTFISEGPGCPSCGCRQCEWCERCDEGVDD